MIPKNVYLLYMSGVEGDDQFILADTFEEALDLYCQSYLDGFMKVQHIGQTDDDNVKLVTMQENLPDSPYMVYYKIICLGEAKKGVFRE